MRALFDFVPSLRGSSGSSYLDTMSPKRNLLRRLQPLEDAAGSSDYLVARQRRQRQNSGEILQTFLAYRLADCAEKMALGIAIGDPLTLRHEPDNSKDPNAVQVFWKDLSIGYIPKTMAALITAEVPEVATGLEAVVTSLSTTSQRDAFRLQISIPITKASRRLRELGINSAFAWDFDRTSGPDKMRLVARGTETAFREMQDLLRASYEVGKCGYSYYPTQDGRHYPWYLSLTDASGRAPADEETIEQLIRSLFGVPSESASQRERRERLEELEKKQEEISQRLVSTRAEAALARRELESSQSQQDKLTKQARQQKDQTMQRMETLDLDLSIAKQEVDLAYKDNEALDLAKEALENTLEQMQEELEFYRKTFETGDYYLESSSGFAGDGPGDPGIWLTQRLLDGLQELTAQLKPRRIVELVNQLCPDSLELLDSAWKSADDAAGFELGDRLFQLLWRLATEYREARLDGKPDIVGLQVFGPSAFAARESQGVEKNQAARRARTFTYGDDEVVMWQHLKIGVKDSAYRTLRIHFHWDPNAEKVVIGHLGKHLPVP